MSLIPPWLPYDWQSCAIVAAGFVLLGLGVIVLSTATLRVALRGDRITAVAMQLGAVALAWSALCGRQILPMARRPFVTQYYWLGYQWEQREIDITAADGVLWGAVGASLLFASLGLFAIGSRPTSEDEEGAP